MTDNKSRIVTRVDEETWLRYDAKRQRARTSFQKIGERLWAEWFAGAKTNKDVSAKKAEPPIVIEDVSADESVWIQKLTDLLRSTEYCEAAKHEIGALHGAMTIDKALARVEEFAREAEADNEAGTGERGAKALEIIRAVKDSIKAARHAVRARSDNTRGRRGNHGHSS